jgi:hypothetical protein
VYSPTSRAGVFAIRSGDENRRGTGVHSRSASGGAGDALRAAGREKVFTKGNVFTVRVVGEPSVSSSQTWPSLVIRPSGHVGVTPLVDERQSTAVTIVGRRQQLQVWVPGSATAVGCTRGCHGTAPTARSPTSVSLDILIDFAYFGKRPECARKGRP